MRFSRETWAFILVLTFAAAIAVLSARHYVGSWNDGSRLATVESIVDSGTLAIDDSQFNGTLDKLYIDGHFYSDKSPVPALLLAGIYQLLQSLFGLKASLNSAAFCWWMTVASSGVAYVVAIICIFRVGLVVELPLRWRLMLTASFGLATVAVVYVQHINNHMLLLGVAAVLMLQATRLPESAPWWRLLLLGCLAGIGYAIDLGAGPLLLACCGALVLWITPSFRGRLKSCAWFAAGALPWLGLHHAFNYAVGGTFRPANAVPEYFNYPGNPFHGAMLTGAWHHESLVEFVRYTIYLLLGPKGLLGHNLALFLLLPTLWPLLRQRQREWPVLMFGVLWCAGTWFLYACTSRNYSGVCLSIRWLVPLLAPCYYALGIVLSRFPHCRTDFCILSAWGLLLMGLAWWAGPWTGHLVPGFWFIVCLALASWALFALWRRSASAMALPDEVGASPPTVISARIKVPTGGTTDGPPPHVTASAPKWQRQDTVHQQ
jgi:hypothetical protein